MAVLERGRKLWLLPEPPKVMASSINRQVAQALLKVMKAKDTSVGQKLKAAELIRVFQGIGPTTPSTPDTENVQPTEEAAKILDL